MASENQNLREAFDAKVRAELRGIAPPPDLRKRILDGIKAPESAPVIRPNFWRPILAAAAALALLASLVWFVNRPPAEDRTFAGFQNRMAGFAVRQYSMDLLTNQLEAVRGYMTEKKAPADFQLPRALAQAPVKGGAKLSWQGTPVAMVCFDGPKQKTLYLFIIESSAVIEPPLNTQVGLLKGLSAAAWNNDGKTYLLAAELPESDLKSFL